MDNDRRSPRQPFDPARIADFLRGRHVVSAELFPLGKSNTNYRLVLSDGTKCVARLHHGPNAAREAAILERVKDVVPVPAVLAFGEDWSVLTLEEGIPLSKAPEATRSAARVLARLSAIRFASAGWIQPDGSVAPFEFGEGFLATMLQRPEVRPWLDETVAGVLLKMEKDWNCRPVNEPVCLVHGDFNPGNILIRDGEVSAVLDWEFAHAGTPAMDIGNLVRHTNRGLHSEIEAGFAEAGCPLAADWKARAEWMDVGAHVEFLTTRRSEAFKRECVAWIHDFIARYGGRS